MSESSRDQQVQAILHSYLQAVDAGQTPDRAEILRQHPALAVELREFFADQAKLDRLAQSLQRGHSLSSALTLGADEVAASSAVPQNLKYFGDYEVLERIGRGGMGVVFRARQVSLNRPVALKMILKGELANAEDVLRFRLEAETAANLDHPNIVPIYEIGSHEGQEYFSMKLVGPGSRRADLGVKETARIMALVARAVHHAHQRGVLHRDLKPSNILFDENGEPNVADFGLAKRVGVDTELTRSGALLGSPSYMAPEQARAEKGLTTAVDVYSLGAILYEWLTGQPPFRGDDVLATLYKVANDEPARPRTLNPKIDRDLETICLKCLHKDPTRRYGSAEMLADDLERWQRGEPILARPVARLERLVKWARRRPERAVLYGLASLVLMIGLSWAAWQGWLVIEDRLVEQRQLVERTRSDLKSGRASCQAGYLDVGMLFLARGLSGAVAFGDGDTERDLRLELGRYAPLLPRLLAMSGHGGGQIYAGEPRYGVSLSRDGKRLVAAGLPWSERILDGDALTPQMFDPAFMPNGAWGGRHGIAISPDGSRFAYGEGVFAPDGKRLLTRDPAVAGGMMPGGDPAPFLLSDPATGRPVGKTLETRINGTVYTFKGLQAAFSPDSSLIACTDAFGVRLLDAATGTAHAPASQIRWRGSFQALAFSPDSKSLATVSREDENQMQDGADADKKTTLTVRLWDINTGKLLREPALLSLHRFAGGISSLTFSPDSKLLLMKQSLNALQMLDLDSGKTRWPDQQLDPKNGAIINDGVRLDRSALPLQFFRADGKTFWTGLYQWDTATGRLLGGVGAQCEQPGFGAGGTRPLTGCARSADGRRVAVVGMRRSSWTQFDEQGKIAGSDARVFETILLWDLSAAASEVKDDAQPLAGTPEQINLWLQAQIGRELYDGASLREGNPALGHLAVNNLRDDLWLRSKEKLLATGGLPMP